MSPFFVVDISALTLSTDVVCSGISGLWFLVGFLVDQSVVEPRGGGLFLSLMTMSSCINCQENEKILGRTISPYINFLGWAAGDVGKNS